jgi:hypothetical protein
MNLKPLFAILATLALALAASGAASAHRTSYSQDNKWKFVFGFLNEPAVTFTKNGLDLQIIDNATGYKIPNIDTVTAELHYGEDHEMEFEDFGGQFGKPGYYTGVVTPTLPGVYTLHLSGSINGSDIDIEIPASHPVEDIKDTYFPAVNDTSADAIAKLQDDVKALKTQVATLNEKVKTQASTPATVTPVASKPAPAVGVALGMGLVGAVALGLALRRRS